MAFNVPTITTSDISFGPAIVYIGLHSAGITPATDVGTLSEDGVSIEITSEKRYISQGNPLVPVYAFSTTQGAKVSFTSLEWNFDRFIDCLGAGVTTTPTGSDEDFKWGGNPLVLKMNLKIQHLMAVSGNTMECRVWECFSDMGLTVPFGQEEHAFEMSFTAVAANQTWGGTALGVTNNILMFYRYA